jgi:GntP family gluconate:H+ symporter
VITAAAIAAPMMGTLGLSPEATMLAGAAGSIIIKYVNSSYFWVCTSLSRMPLKSALLSYGGVTLVNGVAAMAAVYGMWVLGWI